MHDTMSKPNKVMDLLESMQGQLCVVVDEDLHRLKVRRKQKGGQRKQVERWEHGLADE